MLKEKVAQYKEYRKLSRIEKKKRQEVKVAYATFEKWRDKVSRVYDITKPYKMPRNWGNSAYPCEVVYQDTSDLNTFVLNHNIAFAGVPTVFHCPFFDWHGPCKRMCGQSTFNHRYFESKAVYESKLDEYKNAVKNTAAARAKFFGRTK